MNYYISKGFFDTISRSLDEAAMIDGASKNQVFWKIILPLSKPIVVYTLLTSFIGPWGDFMMASYLLGAEKEKYDYIDEELYAVTKLDDIKEEGRLTFNMREGKKKVTVYLPCDATAIIKNFEINDSYETVTKGPKVLWLGDSITQGYGPLRSAHTYVSVANRLLNYEIINQGIGGYIYDKNSLMKMDGYIPDKIIVFTNPVAAKGAAKLGYVPGDIVEKQLSSQIGNILSSKLGDMEGVYRLIEQNALELIPMSNIRGLDTSSGKGILIMTVDQMVR